MPMVLMAAICVVRMPRICRVVSTAIWSELRVRATSVDRAAINLAEILAAISKVEARAVTNQAATTAAVTVVQRVTILIRTLTITI